ncbi:MAG: hypothetical protein EOP06_00395 [Proteobacteria bacterium]|nr:MAG: hypothetical protein EOP06_00395 [Pseudomonadota bacterium]
MTSQQAYLKELRQALPGALAMRVLALDVANDVEVDDDLRALASYAASKAESDIDDIEEGINVYVTAGHEYLDGNEVIQEALQSAYASVRGVIEIVYQLGGNREAHPQLFEAADLLWSAIAVKDGDA